jgi:hypothetical protein
MSSPIHHLDDDTEPTLGYAPPSARERILPVAEPPPDLGHALLRRLK